MNNQLVIDSTSKNTSIAWLQDNRLIELHQEEAKSSFQVGDIYLGKIKKIMNGLNAAFVDIGHDKPGFLHYLDLSPNIRTLTKYVREIKSDPHKTVLLKDFHFEKQIIKSGKIKDVLNNEQEILVQISKEPISTKGPRLSCEFSIPGRFTVLVPFNDTIAVSKKIKSDEERNRLQRLVESIKPQNFGVIVRTVAENKTVAEIDKDLRSLLEKWKLCCQNLKSAKPGRKVLGETNKTLSLLRDILNSSFNSIHVNDENLEEEIKSYVKNISPEQEKIIKLHNTKVPIFEHFGIDKQIKLLFGKTVNLSGGAYLVIEHTEAMHVFDVNSGARSSNRNNQEENALKVNLDAAQEVARQLRLRDMGGIIIIDFIDMHKLENKRALFKKIKEMMQADRSKHKILPPSRFGLIEITRQRVRPEMKIVTVETCPSCKGTGEIRSSVLLIDEIERDLKYLINELNEKNILISVHPFVESYLTKGFKSIHKKWCLQFFKWIKIKPDKSYHLMEYHFFNSNGDKIKL